MPGSIKTFRHVRARVRIERLGEWRPAWVTHIVPERAQLRLGAFALLGAQERLSVECYGDGALVRFGGVAIAQAGQDVAIAVVGSLTFGPSEESVRLSVEGVSGSVWGEREEAGLVVVDASPESLGALVDAPLAPGTVLGMRLATPLGPFEATVGVVNCRPEPGGSGHHRVGLRIVGASRLDAALWNRMLAERAESA